MRVDYRLLGEIGAVADGQPILLGHARQRFALAVLAAEPNTPVSVDRLSERLWGDRQPRSADTTVRSYIARLRRLLPTPHAILRRSGGYLLVADPEQVDLARFRRLCTQARNTEDDHAAVTLYDAALELVRGEPLSGMSSPWAAELRTQIQLELEHAQLDHADVLLRLGRCSGLVGALTSRLAHRPLDERLAGQLMHALHREGRQAEALRVFERTRRLVVDELGVDPSGPLQALHHQILTSNPALEHTIEAPSHRPSLISRQLTLDVDGFTGRLSELAMLGSCASSVAVISGMAGVGKTALAIRWAHQAANRFPDGQLYVDLKGFAAEPPRAVKKALRLLLEGIGIRESQMPSDVDRLTAMWRSAVACRKILVLLDNAADARQVRPLLPGHPGSFALVTSRNKLYGLTVKEGAAHLRVDPLPAADAFALLAKALDRARLSREPEAVGELIERCGRLPLALRIAAAQLHDRPEISLADYTKELAAVGALDALAIPGDEDAAVGSALRLSNRRLPEPVRHTLRLLSCHPGTDFDVQAVAALVGESVGVGRQRLEHLVSVNLLQDHSPGRYRFHDLVHAYAADCRASDEPPGLVREALVRLLTHYRDTAIAATHVLYPLDHRRRSVVRVQATQARFEQPDEARSWLDTEHHNLMAAANLAATVCPDRIVHLWSAVFRHLDLSGRSESAIALAQQALRVCKASGDNNREREVLGDLASIHIKRGRNEKGLSYARLALLSSRQDDDHVLEVRMLNMISYATSAMGRIDEAIRHADSAIAIARKRGNRKGEANALVNFGVGLMRAGAYQPALRPLLCAAQIHRELGNSEGYAAALNNIGFVLERLGYPRNALCCLEMALALRREHGHRIGEPPVLVNIGHARRRLGEVDKATAAYRQALAVAKDCGDIANAAEACNSMGELARQHGAAHEALVHHAEALALAEPTGDVLQTADAHAALGELRLTAGDHHTAVHHWHRALDLYRTISHPNAEKMRHRLTALG